MTRERFNQILNGPLHHPFLPFKLTRLSLALRAVVDATGKQGENALKKHCMSLAIQDGIEEAEEMLRKAGFGPKGES